MSSDAPTPRDASPNADHETFGHEADHSNARIITLAVAGLTSLAVGAVIVVWGIGMLLDPPTERDLLAAPEPVAPRPAIRGALNPRQPDALNELRAREEMRLSSYGWVHREAEVAHLPIERAMEKVVEQGVPDWPPPAATDAGADSSEAPQNDQDAAP